MRSLIRQAVRRGEADASVLIELCDRLLDAGQDELIAEVLRAKGVVSDPAATGPQDALITGSMEAQPSTLTGTGTEDGAAWRHGIQRAAPMTDDAALRRVAELRAQSQGESRPPERYVLSDEIARGGVGAIHLVRDIELMRELVMKTLINGTGVSDYVLKKFIEEAQITAQLEHPNIVPVHDFGHFTGGEVFFTMKMVQGRTLKDIVKKLRMGDADTVAEYTLTRLLAVFRQVCMAVGFAHSRGVVHRDIKPSNVMIGDYGETLVLDWGVAKVLDRDDDEPSADGSDLRVSTLRSQSEDATMMGMVTGTPAYMPPEQAAGKNDRVDARSDIYSLGALLYEILCWRPPFRGRSTKDTLRAVITEAAVPPSRRAPNNLVPARIEALCLRCLRKRPRKRYQTVKEIIADLDSYLAGVEDLDRRVRLSEERYTEGLERVSVFQRARAALDEARDALLEFEWRVPGHAPLEHKRALWAHQAQVAEAELRMHQAFSAAVQSLMASVGFDPDNAEASNELARLYWIKLREAEADNDDGAVIYYRELVEAYNRGLFDEQLKGEGRIMVRSEPPGAVVTASRYLEVDLRQTTLMDEELGQTPLSHVPLGEGDWLLHLRLEGYRDVVHPVRVSRGEVVEVTVRFFSEAQIGAHFLYVPGGQFIMGGDPACASARHRRPVGVDDLFVARYPVTCGEYLAFIQALDAHDPQQAVARMPRLKADRGHLWARGADGRIQLPPIDDEGFRWEPHWPVLGISYDDAESYCAWYSRAAEVPVRLPTEPEWEKTARGTDGRFYPWGNRFDALFCKMAASRAGRATPECVGRFPADCSPYGVFDMSGLVAEYCDSPFGGEPEIKVLKGGHYRTTSDVGCRATHREAVPRDMPLIYAGFRVVRDVPGAGSRRRRVIRATTAR